MKSVLHRSCQLISQWIYWNSCGVQNSTECCKALIILFGYLSQDEQHLTRGCSILVLQHVIEAPAVNGPVIECLASMRGQCIRDAWETAVGDNNFCFTEALGQSMSLILFIYEMLSYSGFMQIKV